MKAALIWTLGERCWHLAGRPGCPPLLEATVEKGRARWVFRCGAVPVSPADNRPVGSRLWLYTNFDCNLRCDYCCVRSSAMINRPSHRRDCGAGRRACAGYDGLGAARVYPPGPAPRDAAKHRSEEHTSELQSLAYLVCRLLLEKKKQAH